MFTSESCLFAAVTVCCSKWCMALANPDDQQTWNLYLCLWQPSFLWLLFTHWGIYKVQPTHLHSMSIILVASLEPTKICEKRWTLVFFSFQPLSVQKMHKFWSVMEGRCSFIQFTYLYPPPKISEKKTKLYFSLLCKFKALRNT